MRPCSQTWHNDSAVGDTTKAYLHFVKTTDSKHEENHSRCIPLCYDNRLHRIRSAKNLYLDLFTVSGKDMKLDIKHVCLLPQLQQQCDCKRFTQGAEF